jgi:H+/Cl- antiporter ClcA
VYTPIFVIGAVLGRIMGELLSLAAGVDEAGVKIIDPAIYAIIGGTLEAEAWRFLLFHFFECIENNIQYFASIHLTNDFHYSFHVAAATAASATHTISTAIIFLELTRQIGLLLPIMVAVLCAVGVGRLFSAKSVYDIMLEQKGTTSNAHAKFTATIFAVTAALLLH